MLSAHDNVAKVNGPESGSGGTQLVRAERLGLQQRARAPTVTGLPQSPQ
jgi:hypothetical protein